MKKKLAIISICFIIIAALCIIAVKLISPAQKESPDSKKLTIVTSFYPVYTLTQNIIGDNPNIDLKNLTSNTSGCLHDYQLTSSNMKTLEYADVLIINGGGMESFVEDAAKAYPDLKIIDSSKGIKLLPNIATHEHSEDEHLEDAHSVDEHSEDAHSVDEHSEDAHSVDEHSEDAHSVDEHSHGEYNAHIWLNTTTYMQQITNIENELCSLFSKYSSDFKENADSYTTKIKELQKTISETFSDIEQTDIIIFHDSFAYLADEIGLNVIECIEIEESSSLSAATISETIDDINKHNIHCLFTEQQFKTTIADSIASETDAKVYVINTLVSGDDSKDAYLNGMKQNIKTIKTALSNK